MREPPNPSVAACLNPRCGREGQLLPPRNWRGGNSKSSGTGAGGWIGCPAPPPGHRGGASFWPPLKQPSGPARAVAYRQSHAGREGLDLDGETAKLSMTNNVRGIPTSLDYWNYGRNANMANEATQTKRSDRHIKSIDSSTERACCPASQNAKQLHISRQDKRPRQSVPPTRHIAAASSSSSSQFPRHRAHAGPTEAPPHCSALP